MINVTIDWLVDHQQTGSVLFGVVVYEKIVDQTNVNDQQNDQMVGNLSQLWRIVVGNENFTLNLSPLTITTLNFDGHHSQKKIQLNFQMNFAKVHP